MSDSGFFSGGARSNTEASIEHQYSSAEYSNLFSTTTEYLNTTNLELPFLHDSGFSEPTKVLSPRFIDTTLQKGKATWQPGKVGRWGLDPESRMSITGTEVQSLQEQDERRRIGQKNTEVSNWIQQIGSEVGYHHDGGQPGSRDTIFKTWEDNEIMPLDDDSHDTRDNRFTEGQIYYKKNNMDAADVGLALEPRPWIDPPSLPYATTTSFQPGTANEAMMRFRRAADDVSVVSRAATWGTRRASLPSLSDNQSEADGTLLYKIQTTSRKQDSFQEGGSYSSDLKKPADSTSIKRSRSMSSMSFAKTPKSEAPIKMERGLTPPYEAKILMQSSKSDVPAQTNLSQLWSRGGPPVFRSDTGNKQAENRDGDEDDDDEDEDEVSAPMSHPESITPNYEGFKAHLRSLDPDIGPEHDWLVSRVAQQQEIRYRNLLQLKIKHLQVVDSGHCPAAGHCLALGGTSKLFDPKGNPRELGKTTDSVQVATDLSDDSTAEDGAITVETFPLGVPMPPVLSLPAEIECQICFKVKKFLKPSDWTKHVHEDLQPFTCTFANCNDPKPFKRKADLVRHENERHRHLEWWQCDIDDCQHICYRKDNFIQHIVREHKLPEPKQKTKAAIKKARATEPAWIVVERCHRETAHGPEDEPCKFCGKSFSTWKKLTVHLAKHMEQIALPVLAMVRAKEVNAETILSPINRARTPFERIAMDASPHAPNFVFKHYPTSGSIGYPPYLQPQPFQATTFGYREYTTPGSMTLPSISHFSSTDNAFSNQMLTPMTSYEPSPNFSLPNPYSSHLGLGQALYRPNPEVEYPKPHNSGFESTNSLDMNTGQVGSENPHYTNRLPKSGPEDFELYPKLRPTMDVETDQHIDMSLPMLTSKTSASYDLEGQPAGVSYSITTTNTCQSIRDWILQGLSVSVQDSSEASFQVSFSVSWSLQSFIQDQYENVPESIGTVITLSGNANRTQAATCNEYVRANWPVHGAKVVDAMQTALESQDSASKLESLDLDISIKLEDTSDVLVEVSGSKDTIVEVVQTIAWMAAAFRTSSTEQVQYSELVLFLGPSKTFKEGFYMSFQTVPLPASEESCWYPLFINPVIARGFPVPPRDNDEAGLEIPIEMMTALGGARYAVDFEGGLLLKGLSTMFVPTKRNEGSIQWHLIHHSAKTRLPYSEVKTRCPHRVLLDQVGHESLQNTRAFLGWWRTSKTYLGTDDFNYGATTYSSAMPHANAIKSSGGALSFSKLLVGNQNMSIGAKDSRLFLSRAGPLEQIMQWAEMMPVLLYDVADKRGWFVRASDVILHIIQTRHYRRPFRIEGKTVRLTGSNPDLLNHAAERAIMDMASIKLFQDDVNRAKDLYLSDLVSDIWALLEGLSEMQNPGDAVAENTAEIRTDFELQGFEFIAVVDQRSPIQRKETTIEKDSGGWQSLIREVNAVVLLAQSFGDLIRPSSPSFGLCPRWKALPKGRGYMAAQVPLLKRLCEEAGSASPYLHLTPSQLQWHRKSMLFEKCAGKTTVGGLCDCERLQQVVPKSASDFMSVNPPGELEDRGCVMFGKPNSISRPLPAVYPAPATENVSAHRSSNGEVDMSLDGLFDDPEVQRRDTEADIPLPNSQVSLSVAPAGNGPPFHELAASADYRYGAIYSKPPRDVEKFYYTPPPTIYSEERSTVDSGHSGSEDVFDIKQQLKRANKRYFDDGGLRDNKRVHYDSAPSNLAERARDRSTNGSTGGVSLSVRDSEYEFGTAPILENPKNRQYVVTLASLDQTESEKS